MYLWIISLFLFLASCGIQSGNNSYNIAVDPTWYPLELKGKDAQVMAFTNELLLEIAEKEKLDLRITKMSWDNIEDGLRRRQYDAMLSAKQPYVFYEKTFSFSDPYLLTGPVLVIPTDASFKEMNGMEIGVVEGSSAISILEKIPGILLRIYETVPPLLDDVVAGNIGGAVIPIWLADSYTQDLYQGKLKIVTAPLDQEGLRVVTLYNQKKELIDAFNHGLRELKKSGKYQKLLQAWGLDGVAK